MEQRKRIPVTVTLIVINVIIYFLTEGLAGLAPDSGRGLLGARLTDLGLLYGPLVAEGQYWRLVTSMFLHASLTHLANNMIALWAFGSYLEEGLGHVRFALLYLGGGFIGSVLETLWQIRVDPVPTLGASGAIFALMGGFLFAALFRRKVYVMPSIRRVLLAIAVSILPGLYVAGVSFTGHLFGLIGGFALSPFVIADRRRKNKPGVSR